MLLFSSCVLFYYNYILEADELQSCPLRGAADGQLRWLERRLLCPPRLYRLRGPGLAHQEEAAGQTLRVMALHNPPHQYFHPQFQDQARLENGVVELCLALQLQLLPALYALRQHYPPIGKPARAACLCLRGLQSHHQAPRTVAMKNSQPARAQVPIWVMIMLSLMG